MKKIFWIINLTVIFVHSIVSAQTSNPLTFSEIMFYPTENNGEFIEIYNTSATQSINLTGYKIKYYTSTADNLVSFIGGMILEPGKFAVIIENDYDYINGIYKNIIPADAIVIKISDASFGTSGMANTTSRDVSLIDPSNNVVDLYVYSADNNPGISDEKFVLSKNNEASNWRNSTQINGTPGKINSVTPISYLNDLSIRLNNYNPLNPVEKDTVFISFVVKNIGALDVNNFSVDIFDDLNGDSTKQANEILYTKDFTDLATGDSLIVQTKFYAPTVGNKLIIGKVYYSIDQNFVNNTAFVKLTVSEKPAGFAEVVINEIMYIPSSDEPEWIEIYNRSDRNINLKNWKVTDLTSTTTIITTDYILAPKEYLVISSDPTISNLYTNPIKLIVRQLPSLNNSGDNVVLKNATNLTIDSVKYLPEWGGNVGGKSLERISSEAGSNLSTNWKTSESKYRATPSQINSVTPKNFDLRVKSITSKSKYAEVGKSLSLSVIIENIGLNNASSFSVKIFKDRNLNNIEDDDEKIFETSGTNLLSTQTREFLFNVIDLNVGLNQFIARVDFLNDNFFENNSQSYKINGVVINENYGDLIINEIMYAPSSGEPEWIEIYNKSNKDINLNGFQIYNASAKNKVVNKTTIIKPEEYFVVTKDSSMFSKYTRAQKFVVANFPTLNNTSDVVVIKDSLDRTIDSLKYKSTWGGSNGKSIERIEFMNSSVDSTNWKTATNILGATPGFVNSVSQKKYDVAVQNILFNPTRPIVGTKVNISCNVKNIGKSNASFKLILNR
ncbi:MAG: lamin tail domain-containing protein, partial [Melioribacteraceae bacterium]|nr:lamin tail domain-containing protein [Melioribacteraceae bacterium]